MLHLFKDNRVSNSLLLLIYALVLRVPAFLYASTAHIEPNSLTTIGDLNFLHWGVFGQIMAALLIFVEAAMINRIAIRNRLYHEINLYPGVMYILLLSFTPANFSFHLFLIVNFIALLSLIELFHVYKIINSKGKVFNIGVFSSLNVCLSIPLIPFYIFYWISLTYLRSFKIQEKFQLFLGYLAPIFIVAVGYFWYDDSISRMISDLSNAIGLPALDIGQRSLELMVILLFVVLCLFTFISYRSYVMKKNMQGVKKINILFWFLLSAMVSALLIPNSVVHSFILLAIPLSILLGMTFTKIANPVLREFSHIALFAGSLFYNIYVFLNL